mmetsp:Transcript_41957/g.135742  ORF Transcript_41957/g.135742 Transcript_41957/m.135742 type:complete len:513 (-) Transcript_41957:88-1626(-)
MRRSPPTCRRHSHRPLGKEVKALKNRAPRGVESGAPRPNPLEVRPLVLVIRLPAPLHRVLAWHLGFGSEHGLEERVVVRLHQPCRHDDAECQEVVVSKPKAQGELKYVGGGSRWPRNHAVTIPRGALRVEGVGDQIVAIGPGVPLQLAWRSLALALRLDLALRQRRVDFGAVSHQTGLVAARVLPSADPQHTTANIIRQGRVEAEVHPTVLGRPQEVGEAERILHIAWHRCARHHLSLPLLDDYEGTGPGLRAEHTLEEASVRLHKDVRQRRHVLGEAVHIAPNLPDVAVLQEDSRDSGRLVVRKARIVQGALRTESVGQGLRRWHAVQRTPSDDEVVQPSGELLGGLDLHCGVGQVDGDLMLETIRVRGPHVFLRRGAVDDAAVVVARLGARYGAISALLRGVRPGRPKRIVASIWPTTKALEFLLGRCQLKPGCPGPCVVGLSQGVLLYRLLQETTLCVCILGFKHVHDNCRLTWAQDYLKSNRDQKPLSERNGARHSNAPSDQQRQQQQ